MARWITSAKLIVLAGFLFVSAGTAWYEWAYVWPVKRCDARGAWWDFRDRQCLTPMPIWRITGRGVVPAAPAPPTSTSSRKDGGAGLSGTHAGRAHERRAQGGAVGPG